MVDKKKGKKEELPSKLSGKGLKAYNRINTIKKESDNIAGVLEDIYGDLKKALKELDFNTVIESEKCKIRWSIKRIDFVFNKIHLTIF